MKSNLPPPLDVGTMPPYTQPVFRFPGSFHPPLVRSLLERHPRAELVGDSMAGCGTSALVSVALGRDAVVADIDPLACLLTRAKCTPVDPGELMTTVERLLDAAGPMGYYAQQIESVQQATDAMERLTPFRAPPNLFLWFHPTIVRDLAHWLTQVYTHRREMSSPSMDAVLAVTAGSIRRVSRADPKPVSGLEVTSVRRARLRSGLRFDLAGEIRTRAALLGEGYSQLLSQPRLGRVQVWESDARDWATLCRRLRCYPDLQVTSPPYLHAINYARRHKLENMWLGLVDRSKYSAHARRFLGSNVVSDHADSGSTKELPLSSRQICRRVAQSPSNPQRRTLERYLLDLDLWLAQVADVAARSGAPTYIVVGASSIGDIRIDTPRLVVDIAERHGMELTGESRHRLVNQRMQYTLRQRRRVRTESVLSFAPNN